MYFQPPPSPTASLGFHDFFFFFCFPFSLFLCFSSRRCRVVVFAPVTTGDSDSRRLGLAYSRNSSSCHVTSHSVSFRPVNRASFALQESRATIFIFTWSFLFCFSFFLDLLPSSDARPSLFLLQQAISQLVFRADVN